MQVRHVAMAAALLGSGLAPAWAEAPRYTNADLGGTSEAPLYTNAELVSIDSRTRVVVVRTNDGKTRRMRLADHVAPPSGLRSGDALILAVREEPDMPLVSRLSRSTESPARPASPAAQPAPAEEAADPAVETLDMQVAQVAAQAAQVDALWSSFVRSCDATPRATHDRGWFALWENQVQVDLSNGFCRDLYDQIVVAGEAVKTRMSQLESSARQTGVQPGDVREVQRRHALSWEGWNLPAPALQREP
jgi:hypothetical protein